MKWRLGASRLELAIRNAILRKTVERYRVSVSILSTQNAALAAANLLLRERVAEQNRMITEMGEANDRLRRVSIPGRGHHPTSN